MGPTVGLCYCYGSYSRSMARLENGFLDQQPTWQNMKDFIKNNEYSHEDQSPIGWHNDFPSSKLLECLTMTSLTPSSLQLSKKKTIFLKTFICFPLVCLYFTVFIYHFSTGKCETSLEDVMNNSYSTKTYSSVECPFKNHTLVQQLQSLCPWSSLLPLI